MHGQEHNPDALIDFLYLPGRINAVEAWHRDIRRHQVRAQTFGVSHFYNGKKEEAGDV
jgi:hypothetical protein